MKFNFDDTQLVRRKLKYRTNLFTIKNCKLFLSKKEHYYNSNNSADNAAEHGKETIKISFHWYVHVKKSAWTILWLSFHGITDPRWVVLFKHQSSIHDFFLMDLDNDSIRKVILRQSLSVENYGRSGHAAGPAYQTTTMKHDCSLAIPFSFLFCPFFWNEIWYNTVRWAVFTALAL